jgi:hypothetical protein
VRARGEVEKRQQQCSECAPRVRVRECVRHRKVLRTPGPSARVRNLNARGPHVESKSFLLPRGASDCGPALRRRGDGREGDYSLAHSARKSGAHDRSDTGCARAVELVRGGCVEYSRKTRPPRDSPSRKP